MTEPINRDQLREAFREAALALGGVFATHPVDDESVRTIVRALGRVIDRHISRAAGRSASMDPAHREPRQRLHPAIVELLASIGLPTAPATAAKADTDREWSRLPGLFRRWELEQVLDPSEEFLIEEAGQDEHGITLFAIFSRPRAGEEGA